MSETPNLHFHLTSVAYPPKRGSQGSAGWDLYSPAPFRVPPIDLARAFTTPYPVRVDLGVSVAIPRGHVGLLSLRSSLGLRGLIIPNSPGIIDSDYRGPLCLILVNAGVETVHIDRGDRIAQLTVIPYHHGPMSVVDELPQAGTERQGGLGSTGR